MPREVNVPDQKQFQIKTKKANIIALSQLIDNTVNFWTFTLTKSSFKFWIFFEDT